MANRPSLKDIFEVATDESQYMVQKWSSMEFPETDNFFQDFVNKTKAFIDLYKASAVSTYGKALDRANENNENYMSGEEIMNEMIGITENKKSVERAYDQMPYDAAYAFNVAEWPLTELGGRCVKSVLPGIEDVCDRTEGIRIGDMRSYAASYREFMSKENLNPQERESGIYVMRAQYLANMIPDGKDVSPEILEELAGPLEAYAMSNDASHDNEISTWSKLYEDNNYGKMIDSLPDYQPSLDKNMRSVIEEGQAVKDRMEKAMTEMHTPSIDRRNMYFPVDFSNLCSPSEPAIER